MAEQLFEMGLAHILSVIGLVASLFVWRAGEMGKTVGRVRQAWNTRCAGAILDGSDQKGIWVSLFQLGLWILALFGCFFVTVSLFSFLNLMAALYEVADHADIALIQILGRHANSTRDSIMLSGFAISAILVLEWIVGVVLRLLGIEPKFDKDGSEASAHLFRIPREWQDAPAEMWRQRLGVAPAGAETISEDWRAKWDAWIRVVGTVRDVSNKGNAEQPGGAR